MPDKPDWKDAPEWANWLTQDKNGEWWWHKRKPVLRISFWQHVGRYEIVSPRIKTIPDRDDWEFSLEHRPKVQA